MDFLPEASILVLLATSMQMLGFLFQKQLTLRILVLTGSGFYILYYLSQTQPLWEAAIGSSLIATANLVGLGLLLYNRMPLGMNGREREVFEALGSLEPGMFRLLMRHGTLHESVPLMTFLVHVLSPVLWMVADHLPTLVVRRRAPARERACRGNRRPRRGLPCLLRCRPAPSG